MSHFHIDPIYGHHVVIAPTRMSRPNAIVAEPWPKDDGVNCPFCVGQEAQTPDPIAVTISDDGSWQIRVVPNRYPALNVESGTGCQEVLIESPAHVASLWELTEEQRRHVFRMYRERLRHFATDRSYQAALLFKNHGRLAGASQYHIHSQVVGLRHPLVAQQRALEAAKRHWNTTGRCAFCDLIGYAQHRDLVVDRSDRFLAFCCATGRTPFETWILPRQHGSLFHSLSDSAIDELCQFMSSTLARLENTVQYMAYNFAIHSAPFDTSYEDHYHWHIVISPRIAGIAGFELATNVFINPVDPRAAAEQLRQAPTRVGAESSGESAVTTNRQ